MPKFPIVFLALCSVSLAAVPAVENAKAEKVKSPPVATPTPKPKAAKAAKAAELKATPTPKVVVAKATPAKATPTPVPAATPAADSTAEGTEPKKAGFFKRMFKKSPKPAATPAATPATTPRPRKAKAIETTAVVDPSAPAASPDKPAVEASPEKVEKPEATPNPKGKKAANPAAAKTANQPPATNDPEVLEKWKYNEAKAKAMEDAEVHQLKEKADLALSEDDGRKALRSYNHALFSKMRRIDPSIKDRIDEMERAILKRLGE